MKKPKGFTLIELLVVIAIIALLLAILMPSLKMAKEHGKRLLCGTNLKNIGQALVLYSQQEDDELPMNFYQYDPLRRNHSNPMAAFHLGWYDPALETASADERLDDMLSPEQVFDSHNNGMMDKTLNFGYLMKEGLIDKSYKVVYCPSNRSQWFSYMEYGGEDDWPKGRTGPDGSNDHSVRISYSYLPQSKYKKHPSDGMNDFPDAAYKYSKMDNGRSVALDMLDGVEMAHKSGAYIGVNMLYGDGSVLFHRDEEGWLKSEKKWYMIENGLEFRKILRLLE